MNEKVTPLFDRLRRSAENSPAAATRPLPSGGGGDTFDPMETRVKALEEKIGKMDDKLDAIRTDLSYVKGKLDSMPSSLQLLGFIIAVLGIAGLAKYFAP